MQRLPAKTLLLASLVAGGSAAGCASNERGFRPPEATTTTRADARSGAGDTDFMQKPSAPPDARADQVGLATWYGSAFAGRKTSNGERFDPAKLTAAHRTLPFGTWVEVRRVDTGRAVRVRINDRGPWGDSRRVIDLSKKAADELGLVRDGVARVELRVVDGP